VLGCFVLNLFLVVLFYCHEEETISVYVYCFILELVNILEFRKANPQYVRKQIKFIKLLLPIHVVTQIGAFICSIMVTRFEMSNFNQYMNEESLLIINLTDAQIRYHHKPKTCSQR